MPLNLYDCVSDEANVSVCKKCKKAPEILIPWRTSPREKNPLICVKCLEKEFGRLQKIVKAVASMLDLPKTAKLSDFTDHLSRLKNERDEYRRWHDELASQFEEAIQTLREAMVQAPSRFIGTMVVAAEKAEPKNKRRKKKAKPKQDMKVYTAVKDDVDIALGIFDDI